MKRSRIFGYSALTLIVIAGIILAVLGALGYLTPHRPSGGGGAPIIPGGANMTATIAELYDIEPMFGLCVEGKPRTFDGVKYMLRTACQVTTCEDTIVATYFYPDGTSNRTTRTVGNSGLYHNPPTNPDKIPTSAKIELYTGANLENTYNINIPSSC